MRCKAFAILILNCMSLVALSVISAPAQSTPAEIIILRHGEKPGHSNELSRRGWHRAEKIPQMLTSRSPFNQFGAPVRLIGMSPDREGGSIRSLQTLEFAAKEFGVRVEETYEGDDVRKLARDVMRDPRADGKTVVICWHRRNISELISSFGAPKIEKPQKEVYDRVWTLIFPQPSQSAGVQNPSLVEHNQHLLSGDR